MDIKADQKDSGTEIHVRLSSHCAELSKTVVLNDTETCPSILVSRAAM